MKKGTHKKKLSIDQEIDYGFLQIFGSYDFKICIPDSSPEDLKQKIMAASKSSTLGIRSVDYILKKYGPWDLNNKSKSSNPLDNIIIELLLILNDFSQHLIDTSHVSKDKSEGLGFTAASISMQRCRATFDSILLLLKRGFAIEARILGRTVIEQIAWSLTVVKLKTLEEVHKVQPQRTITNLKREYPFAGVLYGDLSNYTHLSSKQRHEYFLFYKNKGHIIFRNRPSSLRFAMLLILLVDCYIVTFEKLCLEHEPRNTAWIFKNGKWELNNQRASYKLWLKHRKGFFRLSERKDQLKLKRYLRSKT